VRECGYLVDNPAANRYPLRTVWPLIVKSTRTRPGREHHVRSSSDRAEALSHGIRRTGSEEDKGVDKRDMHTGAKTPSRTKLLIPNGFHLCGPSCLDAFVAFDGIPDEIKFFDSFQKVFPEIVDLALTYSTNWYDREQSTILPPCRCLYAFLQ